MDNSPPHPSMTDMTSISYRFSRALIGVVTLILVIFAATAIIIDGTSVSASLEKRLENSLKLAQTVLPTPLWNLDNDVVEDFLEALFLDESMVYAEITWKDQVISQKARRNAQHNLTTFFADPTHLIDKHAEITYKNNKIGTIRLVMSRESVEKELLRKIIGTIALTLLIVFAITTTSLILTKKYITLPLLRLQGSASAIARGDLDTLIDQSNKDEIGLLARHLDDMRKSLKKLFDEVRENKEKIEQHSRTLELQVASRTRELAQSVEELKALGDISQIVSATLHLETVLRRIISHAVELSEADAGTIFKFDEAEQIFVPKINIGVNKDFIDAIFKARPQIGDNTAIGQAAQKRGPVQIPNLAEETNYPLAYVIKEGFRALLAVPLLLENQLIGGLVVQRKTVGEFPERVVNLLQTFAGQSGLAIHNATLFKKIEEKSRQLEVADRHKSEFLANMSHELRTPLNAILGYTELILDNIYGPVPEKIAEVLRTVEKSGRHLLTLINDILDLSKIEAGQLSLSFDEYSMVDLIRSVSTSVEPLAAEKKLELAVHTPPEAARGVGDEQRLAQVLINLLGNAIKFTDTGSVTTSLVIADQSFLVSVADTGIGLSTADKNIIFKDFQQVDGSSTRTRGGTGLGLAIAKKIVEMHGGRFWVESVPRQGSTFSFSIPIHAEQQSGNHEQDTSAH